MKVTSIAFIIGALALAGVPGLAGFFSKDLILEEVAHRGLYAPLAALLIAAFLTAFYMGKVVFLALFGKPSSHAEHAHEAPASMLAPLVLLAGLAVVAGYFGATLSGLYGEPVHFHVAPIGLIGTAMGLSGLGLAYWMFGAPQGGASLRAAFAPLGRLAASGYVDKTFAFAYRKVLSGLADGIGWFDRYVIDGLMNGIAYGTLESGSRLRVIQTGRVGDYVYVIVAAMVLMGLYGAFWR
jgi:NADH-quinone oxidoreductase subunit L